jgi:predicted ATP-grasp superfamily ATP-dependent carboligase
MIADGADTTTPAVVLKFDPNVMHHGGLGAIRSLGRSGIAVHSVHEHRLAPAAHSRYVSGRWLWNPRPEQVAHVLSGLKTMAERIGTKAVLLPTDDAGAIFLAEHGESLRTWFYFPSPPRELPRKLAGKHSLFLLCRELGLPSPRAAVPATFAEARQFAATVGFPVVAKLCTGWLGNGSSGLRSTQIVPDTERLRAVYEAAERASVEVMAQEFIPQEAGQDWFFHGYVDSGGRCRPAFTGVKERSYPANAGLTSFGRSEANDALRHQVTDMLEVLGYRGIVDVDLRYDPRDGEYKVLDCNPRLGAQFRIFRDTAGLDIVLAQYLDLTGQRPAVAETVQGRGFLVENYDPLAALRYWRDGQLRPAEWLRSLRRTEETAWFARDDLLPFGLMSLRMASRLAGRSPAHRSQQVPYPEPRYLPRLSRAPAGRNRSATDHLTQPRQGELT